MYMLETVDSAVKRLQKNSNCAFQCDSYYYFYLFIVVVHVVNVVIMFSKIEPRGLAPGFLSLEGRRRGIRRRKRRRRKEKMRKKTVSCLFVYKEFYCLP